MIFYSSILALTGISLLSLCVLISENGRMTPEAKKRAWHTYGLLFFAALTEWLSAGLNGAPAWTKGIHIFIKSLDYVFTPIVGLLFIRQISWETKRNRMLELLMILNAVLQFASCFAGLTFYVDESNVYHHGPWYFIYILVYAAVFAAAALEFFNYSKKFRKANRMSFFLILLITGLGILMQEGTGGQVRLSYLSLTISAILLFIHNNEHGQQQMDDVLLLQRRFLEKDELSGLKSRFAYSERLKKLNRLQALPEDTTVLMIDVNGLKAVNDSLGHEAGDELIAGVGKCIQETFSAYGECYRTGGDEFVVIVQVNESHFPEMLCAILKGNVKSWSGVLNKSASVSCGYACAGDFPDYSIEKLVGVADERMYEQKAQYYKTEGRDRRKRLPGE